MALAQGQYGGQLTPQVTGAGAAVLSNLGSAAMGMLTGGGSVAIQAAMEATKETSTTQRPETTIGPQSTGSKVFNLPQTADAFANNDFWANVTGTKVNSSSNTVIIAVVAIVALLVYFIMRRK